MLNEATSEKLRKTVLVDDRHLLHPEGFGFPWRLSGGGRYITGVVRNCGDNLAGVSGGRVVGLG